MYEYIVYNPHLNCLLCWRQRRRMETELTEAKVKVVASVWGKFVFQFLATLAICLGRFGRIG